MHGRVKVRTTAEQEALKKIEREKKLVKYKAAISLIFQKRKDKIWDSELMLVTEQMILNNSDISTLWNIRREAFKNNDWQQEERTEKLKRELSLTESCVREYPKSYSVWHHRTWVIDNLPEPDWKTELALCSKCLNLDERNFHCWDYRNYLVKKAGISDAEELDFSTTKILNNFSNYSSWHYRSKILSKMFPDEIGYLPIRADKHKEELDLVMNATFTDPNDSSAWFYQRWLLDSETKPNTLWRAQITNAKAVIIFTKDIRVNSENVTLLKNEMAIDGLVWKSSSTKEFSKCWTASLADQPEFLTAVESIAIKFEDNINQLYQSENKNVWMYKVKNSLVEQHNKLQLKEQMESYKQLNEMEPNNKWSLLTGIFLMKKYDMIEYNSQILQDLSSLLKVDQLRSNYYADMRSKCIMEFTLHNIWSKEGDEQSCTKIDLSGLNLTMLYNEHCLALFEEINLGANKLSNSLYRLSVLQECKKLSLSSNKINSLKHFPTLLNLEALSLRNNELWNVHEILDLVKRHEKLTMLDLRDNPINQMNPETLQFINMYANSQL